MTKSKIFYPPQGAHIKANIHHNHMVNYPDYAFAVWGEWVDDVIVHQNTVEGNSQFGLVFGWWGLSYNGKIMENDLSNYTSISDPFKEIGLGPGTENYKVTVYEEDSVLDLGTNNTVNERPRRGQFGYDAAFIEMMNQKMMLGKEFMPWSPRYQVLPLLAPVNYLYLPAVQAK